VWAGLRDGNQERSGGRPLDSGQHDDADASPDTTDTHAGPAWHDFTHIGVISLGSAGSVYTSTLSTLLRLGISKPGATAFLARLSALSIARTHDILRTRRRMDQRGIG
jgi:hypothetical protein